MVAVWAITGLQTLVNCHPTSHSQLSADLKAASALSRSQVKRHGLSNYYRDVVVPQYMCESIPGSPPPFLFFVGAREEPGNEAKVRRGNLECGVTWNVG